MAGIEQADVVGNFLNSYYGAQDRQQQAARQQMADQRAAQQFDQQNQQFQWSKEQHDAAAKADAVSEAILNLRPGDVQGFEAAKQGLLAKGVITPQEAAQYDISHLPDLQAQSAKWREIQTFRLEQQRAQSALETDRAQRANIYSEIKARNAKPVGGGSAPQGYQWVRDPSGAMSLAPIKGGPADPEVKPLTDEQAKAAGFAARMVMADKSLSDPTIAGQLMSGWNNTVNELPLGLDNALVTNDYQVGDQATRELINAQLRRESGAAIGTGEFSSGNKQYIPRYGDKEDVLLGKAASRKLAIANMWNSAGPRFKDKADAAMADYNALIAKIQDKRAGTEKPSAPGQPQRSGPQPPPGFVRTD